MYKFGFLDKCDQWKKQKTMRSVRKFWDKLWILIAIMNILRSKESRIIIRAVLTYRLNCWNIYKALLWYERCIVRRIFCPIYIENAWLQGANLDMMVKCNDCHYRYVVQIIKLADSAEKDTTPECRISHRRNFRVKLSM